MFLLSRKNVDGTLKKLLTFMKSVFYSKDRNTETKKEEVKKK